MGIFEHYQIAMKETRRRNDNRGISSARKENSLLYANAERLLAAIGEAEMVDTSQDPC